jgi:hypothetical protein
MLSSSILDMRLLGVSADATHELHPVIKKELAVITGVIRTARENPLFVRGVYRWFEGTYMVDNREKVSDCLVHRCACLPSLRKLFCICIGKQELNGPPFDTHLADTHSLV